MADHVSAHISREGRLFIFTAFSAAVVAFFVSGPLAVIPFAVIGVVLIYLYRDPKRNVPASPLAVLSPVDGTVIAVATVDDPYLQRKAKRVTIQMPLTGPFTTRSPVEGKVVQGWFGGGKAAGEQILAGETQQREEIAESPASRGRMALWMHTDELDDVVMTVLPRRLGFSPHCYIHVGQRVGQGQRCGCIPFGARVEVLLPESTRVMVKPGDKLLAGSGVVATVIHRARTAPSDRQPAERAGQTGVQDTDAA